MTDIATRAKRLLEDATPGPWFVESGSFGAVYSVGPISPGFEPGSGLDCEQEDADLAAAAPELAKTVIEQAEEIERLKEVLDWEYSFEVKNSIGQWEIPTSRAAAHEPWWPDLDDAKWAATDAHELGYPCRIVRRRVSPPEVINE